LVWTSPRLVEIWANSGEKPIYIITVILLKIIAWCQNCGASFCWNYSDFLYVSILKQSK
jgi:hypothetical protein